ncbi:PEP-CTERM sorting domain-containing protein [Candidatus Poribacteria bacterium]|nr:PEP-CTERM sorting domain-containing protein [Candidatus Poribacteria bacterium]
MLRRNTATTNSNQLMTRLIPILAACVFLFSTVAQATPLNLTLPPFPDIMADFIDVTYDAGTHAFSAMGFAETLDDDGSVPPETITGITKTFTLSATIDNLGVLQPGGTLTILGKVPSLVFNSGTLLTGDLTAFGFPNAGGDPLEFLFNVTGGDAAGLYGSVGGVILSSSGFGGSFATNFDNLGGLGPGNGNGVADVAPIPEPSTILLFMTGLGIVLGHSALRKRSKGAKV